MTRPVSGASEVNTAGARRDKGHDRPLACAARRAEESVDVCDMKPGGRLIEDVDPPRPAIRAASYKRCRSAPDSVVSGWPMVR